MSDVFWSVIASSHHDDNDNDDDDNDYKTRVHSSLVDPASSHMLVSKIKPCMSQYKPN